jgi:diaminohydroxyphosphoribosylaminopyrimidine deaminase/5-amino-6-(5-phosphoribosylamino)uracil reductase
MFLPGRSPFGPDTASPGSPEHYMGLALAEAQKGRGRTHPNPPVGSVVVRDGRVVGRGYHHRAGLPHAEVEALLDAGPTTRGADLYVTLEPCAHFGRTPPCTQAILDAGIARVFVGSRDPNPLVSGRGVQSLRDHGVEVVEQVRRADCDALAREFFQLMTTGRPFVTLKAAVSLDGRIATRSGNSRWISSPAARALVHAWRDEHDAILVGAGTVLADDPLLTTRLEAPLVEGRPARTGLRIVVDGRLRSPASSRVFDVSAGPVLVLTTVTQGPALESLRARGVDVESLPGKDGRIAPAALLAALGRRGLTSLFVEGGADVHAGFVRAGLFDELRLFLAPMLVGGDAPGWVGELGLERLADANRLVIRAIERVGEDLLLVAEPRRA